MDALRADPRAVETFLVEGYWPDARLELFADVTARLDATFDGLRRDGFVLRTVAATLVPQDEAAYWLVRAPSADLVATACALAGVPVERIIEAFELRAKGAPMASAEDL